MNEDLMFQVYFSKKLRSLNFLILNSMFIKNETPNLRLLIQVKIEDQEEGKLLY